MQIMAKESRHIIREVIRTNLTAIIQDVEFKYLRPKLIQANIFPRRKLEKAQAEQGNTNQMTTLLCNVHTLSPEQFETFLCVLRDDYAHIETLIRTKLDSLREHSRQNELHRPTLPDRSPQNTSQSNQAPSSSRQDRLQDAVRNNTSLNTHFLETKMSQSSIQNNSQEGLGPQSSLSKYQEMVLARPHRVYPMETSPRGLAVIINNEQFDHLPRRDWSAEDERRLRTMFRLIGFQVCIERNQSTQKIVDKLKWFATFQKLKEVSALAVAILSHGGRHDIMYGSDGQYSPSVGPVAGTYISKSQLMDTFKQEKCPLMCGKPKLFIVQCCRGGEDDKLLQSDSEEPDVMGVDSSHGEASRRLAVGQSGEQLPVAAMADMCFVHSSSLGYKSYRQRDRGSPFVEAFTAQVLDKAETMEFRDIIREVQNQMKSQLLPTKVMTLPDFTCPLTNDWFLNPPRRPLQAGLQLE